MSQLLRATVQVLLGLSALAVRRMQGLKHIDWDVGRHPVRSSGYPSKSRWPLVDDPGVGRHRPVGNEAKSSIKL